MNNFRSIFENQFQNVLFDEPMKKHTTFRIGGNADVFVVPKSVGEVEKAVGICKKEDIPFYVIGNGSNVLVGDGGFRGVIIQLFKNFGNVEVFENVIKADSGALLTAVSKKALECSLSGLEFAAGIPGTVGGGVCMNAGAYGGELKDVVQKITVLHDGKVFDISSEDACFEYRNSKILKEKMLVISTEMCLEKGVYSEIKEKMNEFNKMRTEKQPLEFPSAGSTFKRPEGYFAGKLIMDSGLRGYSVGDAVVSEKHCGFVINKGNASAKDVLTLINNVKEIVFEKFGVVLEPEVRVIGEF